MRLVHIARTSARLVFLHLALISTASVQASVGTLADSDGEAVAWGYNTNGQTTVPSGAFTAIAAGSAYSLGIKSDGTLAGWGYNGDGQTTVPSGTFAAVAAGGFHGLGLKSNGTLAGWGYNLYGQTTVPSGTFTAVDAGDYHSLGIMSDGTLAGWGDNTNGQTAVPSGTFTAVAAGGFHSLGLKSNGTLAGWGYNNYGQTTVPSGTFTAVDAGAYHSLGIKSDGTLAGWGDNTSGQTAVPNGTFTAVAAGYAHSLGIKSDGTIAGWGLNNVGQLTVPSGTFVAVAAGDYHGLALRAQAAYSGDLLISGTGMTANLNRSIHVAGNARIESPMYMFNNPLMSVAGNVTFTNNTGVVGTGTISAGGGLEIASGTQFYLPNTLTLSAAGPLMGGGNIWLEPGARLTTGLSNATLFTGVVTTDIGAALNFTGTGFTSPSGLYHSGSLRLGAGQRMQVAGLALNAGSIELLGIAAIGGASELEIGGLASNFLGTGLITGRDAVMRFSGGLTNLGAVSLTHGTNDVSGDITNQSGASIVVTGGANATFYDDVVQNGTLQVRKVGSTTSTAVFLGSFTGSGGSSGGGDIFFDGDLRPGNSPATVNFDNNIGFGSTAQLEIELGGVNPGTQYDQINVVGALALDGTLALTSIGGFVPVPGDRFTVATYVSRSGTFASVTGTNPAPGIELHEVYQANQLVVLTTVTGEKTWGVDANGNSSLAGNWIGGVAPGGVGDVAAFTTIITTPRTVTIDAPLTLGTIRFDDDNNYSLQGPSPLTLQAAGANHAAITVQSTHGNGAHTIAAPITLASDLDISQNSSGALTLAGTLDNPAGHSLTKTGAGTLTISGPQNHGVGAALATAAGTTNINSDGGANLAINVNAATNFGATQHLASLSIGPAATTTLVAGANKVLVTSSQSIDAAGMLNLADNDLVVLATPATRTAVLADVSGKVAAAFHGGLWDQPGITSSAAAADAAHLTMLGVILNDNGAGQPLYPTFDDQVVDTNSVLTKYTYYGDANLSGVVDGTDYALIDNGFNFALSGWLNGDFNYDGHIDGTDYAFIDNAFNFQGGPLAIVPQVPLYSSGGPQPVPEPSSWLLLALGLASTLAARRFSSKPY